MRSSAPSPSPGVPRSSNSKLTKRCYPPPPMRPPLLGALCALLVSLFFASPASAVPDGPLDVYLEHLEPLSLEWPVSGTMTDGYGPRWGRLHTGIDIGILQSLDVHAAHSGTVTASGYLNGYSGY